MSGPRPDPKWRLNRRPPGPGARPGLAPELEHEEATADAFGELEQLVRI